MTNLDKIRYIDSDGLAYFLTDITDDKKPWCQYSEDCDGDCFRCCENWLFQEVDENAFD